MIVMNYLAKSVLLPAEEYNAVNFPPRKYITATKIYISPNNNETQKIADGIASAFLITPKFSFVDNINDLRQEFLKDFKNSSIYYSALGIDFEKSNNFPFDYTLLTNYDSKLFDKSKIKYFTDTRACRNNSKDILNSYESCGANEYAYDGLAFVQNTLNNFIRKVRELMPKKIRFL
jgi:hypothetical protein